MVRNPIRILAFLLTFAGIALYLGCQPSQKADKSNVSGRETESKSSTQSAGAKSDTSLAKSGEKRDLGIAGKDDKTLSKRSTSKTPLPPLAIPKVGLTETLRATCLVNVGDIMPGGEPLAADGRRISVQSQYGEKFTVLFFWSEGGSNYARLTADSALKDIQDDLIEPYAGKGLKVIGVNVGDKPPLVRQQLEKIGVKLTCYFDPDKAFFGRVATSKLPRIYLLDASGKIIWFDTDYSQATRRNLMQAVSVVLAEK